MPIAALLLLALTPTTAHAYFDPGAGTVLLQLLVAAGIGVIYRIRHWLAAAAQALRKMFRR